MSRQNVTRSLEAVEKALSHLVQSLERGGFEAGAATYLEMARVVVAQCLWANSHDATDLAPRFQELGRLALRARTLLSPYVEAMERLGALTSLAMEETPATAPAPEEHRAICQALGEANGPLSRTRIRKAVDLPLTAVRQALDELVRAGRVRTTGKRGHIRYQLGREPSEPLDPVEGGEENQP